MIPELGHFCLILALFLCAILSTVPIIGSFTGQVALMQSARSLATGFFVFTALAFACLTYAFLNDDFTVRYVATNSNSLLPSYYKVSAVWGGHEGSLLLWVLILSIWTFSVAIFSRNLPLEMLARVLAVMGVIGVGFLLFTLLTSNPFDRLLPTSPADGNDLNPLLQDPGLIIHPPMLYMGYVGFSVAFAFAIAALIGGRLDSAWARWSRPWTTTAWSFLTLGIALGSWWAYYELGWGGWWFWDPVENASFMPWLVGTALIHSLAVTEKRGVFKSWTILLAIFAFSLSLLGTFLVRSGVITSVHAFASDPERGVFILLFLLFVVGGSLLLYAFRVPEVKAYSRFDWLSRETFLLGNNVLLVVITATVLLGTLYPLIADALGWGRISVGPPYFNFFFTPLTGLLCLLMGIGPILVWKKTKKARLIDLLKKPIIVSTLIALVFPAVYGAMTESAPAYSIGATLTVFVGAWILSTMASDLLHKTRNAASFAQGLKKLTPSYYGMIIAHVGVAFCAMGACLNTIYSDQRDLRMESGNQVEVGGLTYHFDGVEQIRGPNYVADRGTIRVMNGDSLQSTLFPEKRRYFSGGNTMTEASIDAGFFRDLYVALGEPLDDKAWAVRVHFKPFVRWIWLGAIFMGLGGILAIVDKRYRASARKKVQAAQHAETTTQAETTIENNAPPEATN
ncbi:heme lyase CcmF/NrfE family subunit [Marinibactrum halimedae]|uniref:Cytochrome c-type biogenesis protein CcmF n=1 Tax=Marinibactrum halimedae TaxID=1444977 RepID=A0AA37TEB0_9GAMM|nr:heme lyase CcmF/NrfE family subunit [Marinibactrum halimedae]MCD9460394.1 heme lyase CcmF/NrfE family subunit [Marinibactrum halimedae]GLS27477.1 cytochrome c-type biogenesis protein CcmF [Marinibactrum halimedae]